MHTWLQRALFLVIATTIPDAWALSQPMNGIQIDLAAGAGGGGTPLTTGVGWQASASYWSGNYDSVYSLGRFWGIGATLRQDYTAQGLRTAPMLEVRRGMDLIVVGITGHFSIGPVLDAGGLGGTIRAGLSTKLRRHAYWGLTLRLEGGVELFEDRVGGQFGILLGGSFARPFQKVQ